MHIATGLDFREYSKKIVDAIKDETCDIDAAELIENILRGLVNDCGVATEDSINPEFIQSIQDIEDALNGKSVKRNKISPEEKAKMETNYENFKKIIEKSKL